jgi:hypothetical protein
MSHHPKPECPECAGDFDFPDLDRRDFFRAAAAGAAVAGLAATPNLVFAEAKKDEDKPAQKKARPAEDMIRELFADLSETQKKAVVLPFDHGAGKNKKATRLSIAPNRALLGRTIDKNYTKTQQELLQRVIKSLANGDEGYRQISRDGTWDASRSFGNCGALIFGDPSPGKKFAWVFTGHHLTVRCDGDFADGEAFGGPMYYGHSPNGYSKRNLFFYQTRAALSVFDSLSEQQRKTAVIDMGDPGEGDPSVKFKKKAEERPGIAYADLTKDQQKLVEKVMREVLSPYRKEDADEVMLIIKKNGGMEKIQLAFYKDFHGKKDEPWSFWRLEGPGFVWNYRVLPHVHTYVNISTRLA